MNVVELDANALRDREYYYVVLNLPKSASQEDIRERYRALSLVYHPDKQRDLDASTAATAEKRFLEVQKAYEVLSDPFTRQVYDILGEEGLKLPLGPELRAQTPEKVREILHQVGRDIATARAEELVRPRGGLTVGFYATPLIQEAEFPPSWGLSRRLAARLGHVHMSNFSVRHSIQHKIGENTTLHISARLGRKKERPDARLTSSIGLIGTVRHQFNPRLSFEASSNLFGAPIGLNLKSAYNPPGAAYSANAYLSPLLFAQRVPPPVTLSYARQLYPDSATQGVVTAQLNAQPSVTVMLVAPRAFDLLPDTDLGAAEDARGEDPGVPRLLPEGAVAPFLRGARYSQAGFALAGPYTRALAEWGVTFADAALDLKAQAALALSGAMEWALTGTWTWSADEGSAPGTLVVAGSGGGSVSASVALGVGGVYLRIEIVWLGQRLTIPLTLADEMDNTAALWAISTPAIAWTVWHALVLRPRRGAQRARFFRSARERLADANTDARREAAETLALLREPAARHMRTERSRQGLVIESATYGPIARTAETAGLEIDVAPALQALVHASQLHIPGGRPKAQIPGLFDPVPGVPKFLRVRYTFRGRAHYAEIGDVSPVVLPLEEHLVR